MSKRRIGDGLTFSGAALPSVGRRDERSVVHYIVELCMQGGWR